MHAMPPSLESGVPSLPTYAAGEVGFPSGPQLYCIHSHHSDTATPQSHGGLHSAVRGTEYATRTAKSDDPPPVLIKKMPSGMNQAVAMEHLDQILASFVPDQSETAGNDKLLGAAFIVVNKDGMNGDNVCRSMA